MRACLLAGVGVMVLTLSACQDRDTEVTVDAEAAVAPDAAQPETPEVVEAAGFRVEDVPESTATLPPFPFFDTPEGLTSRFTSDADRHAAFDIQHFVAGDRIVAQEGRVFHDAFGLEPRTGRRYTAVEFHRNYENAIRALGGMKISEAQFTAPVVEAFGGRAAVEAHYRGACVAVGCQNESYLIRQDGKEYWINVSTGRIPLSGFVTVLERQAMTQSLGFLSADDMKQALDADGRVALYVNFDTDRATLRPDAAPVITEIVALLRANPALRLSVEGHTDDTGTATRNRTLSAERAAAVRAALIAEGIAADRLTSQGFGSSRPLAANDSDANRARNRRVELVRID